MLAVARVTGETAPLSVHRLDRVVLTEQPRRADDHAAGPIYTTHAPVPGDGTRAWGAALILVLLVLILNVVARLVVGPLADGRKPTARTDRHVARLQFSLTSRRMPRETRSALA